MRAPVRVCAVGACCGLIAVGAVTWITQPIGSLGVRRASAHAVGVDGGARKPGLRHAYPNPGLATFSDPNARVGSTDRVFLDPFAFDGSVFSATTILADENRDVGSLKEYREVIAVARGGLGRISRRGLRV